MKTIILLLTLLSATPCFAGRVIDLDHQINSWVSSQRSETDDVIHFTTGATIFGLSYWGLGKLDYFQEHVWQRRILSATIPLSLRIYEESTNRHPDWKHDITWNVIGIGFVMTFTFDEVQQLFEGIK